MKTTITQNFYKSTKKEKLNGHKTYLYNHTIYIVENGEITACTEIYCENYKKPICTLYEITDSMQNLLDHVNGEIMYMGGSRYFDESIGKNNIDLMIKDIKNYTKLLKVDGIDEETKEKIEN